MGASDSDGENDSGRSNSPGITLIAIKTAKIISD